MWRWPPESMKSPGWARDWGGGGHRRDQGGKRSNWTVPREPAGPALRGLGRCVDMWGHCRRDSSSGLVLRGLEGAVPLRTSVRLMSS